MESNYAWAAGLVEGEGCFTWHSDGKRPYFLMDMCDEDVLRKFQIVFPETSLRGPYFHKYKVNQKPRFRIDAYGDKCITIMKAIYPWLGERRKAKIDELLSNDNNSCK